MSASLSQESTEVVCAVAAAAAAAVVSLDAYKLAQPPPALPPAQASSPAAEEEVPDRDFGDSFDASISLLPGDKFPTALDLFSISVRNAALRGWVKQPAPCCAASSIAGCFNTVRGLDRQDRDNGAVDAADVIKVMNGQLDEDRAAKHASVARLLGLRDVEVLSALEKRVGEIQDAKGRSLTSRKKLALKPPDLRAALREATDKATAGGFEGVEELEAELWKALDAIYSAADAAKAAGAPAASDASVILVAEDRAPLGAAVCTNAGGADADEDDEGGTSAGACGADAGGAIALQRDVNKALVSALQVHIGQLKLRAENPSTAFFGNGDVLKCVRKLSEHLGIQVVGRNYCGKGLKGAKSINLDANDSLEKQEEQWRSLVSEFARSDTALLMHMTNHYCMIYATREWAEPAAPEAGGTIGTSEANGALAEARVGTSKRVRQVLSAKPGQRPSRWLEWEDLRKQMLGWAGYKVLALKIEG